jgi:hypothetical protein
MLQFEIVSFNIVFNVTTMIKAGYEDVTYGLSHWRRQKNE